VCARLAEEKASPSVTNSKFLSLHAATNMMFPYSVMIKEYNFHSNGNSMTPMITVGCLYTIIDSELIVSPV